MPESDKLNHCYMKWMGNMVAKENGGLCVTRAVALRVRGDGKCPRFKLEYLDNKTNIVWKDKRKPAVSFTPVRDFNL